MVNTCCHACDQTNQITCLRPTQGLDCEIKFSEGTYDRFVFVVCQGSKFTQDASGSWATENIFYLFDCPLVISLVLVKGPKHSHSKAVFTNEAGWP